MRQVLLRATAIKRCLDLVVSGSLDRLDQQLADDSAYFFSFSVGQLMPGQRIHDRRGGIFDRTLN
jgi:hypothetical protein